MRGLWAVGNRWLALLGMSIALCALGAAASHAQTEHEFAAARALMVEAQVATAGVKDPTILAVLRDTPRHEFLSPDARPYAYHDMSLPIGEQQTISPPFIVATMTEKLDVQPSDKVLEIGTGSGYQAAVHSRLCTEVYTIEIIEPLAKRASGLFGRLGYRNVQVRTGDGFQGWPEHAPFDKIIVTCSPEQVPQPLVDQLREKGRIVIPVGERYQQLLYSFVKRDGKLQPESREPTYFVPMTGTAESLRRKANSGPLTPIINGDFEQQLAAGTPAGWYYLRQATLEDSAGSRQGNRCLSFANRVAGCSSQALQAIGLDGREVSELVVDLWVRARNVCSGELPHQRASVLVSFFDENRASLGQPSVGSWSGSFEWSHKTAALKVPPETRGAIVAVGLLGATGELSCDGLSMRAGDGRATGR